MRYLLLLCLVFLEVPVVCGQTLHVVFFIDSRDGTIGKYCDADLLNMKGYCSRIATCIGYTPHFVYYRDTSFTRSNFENASQQLGPTGKDDIILVYVSSHGRRSPGSTDAFPEVNFGGALSSVSALHHRFARLEHKVLITLSDICNVPFVVDAGPETGEKSFDRYDPPPTPCEKDNMKAILTRRPFDLLITSSSENQASLILSSGSVFTNTFIESMKLQTGLCTDERLLTIREVLDRTVSQTTIRATMACMGGQYKGPGTCTPQEPFFVLTP